MNKYRYRVIFSRSVQRFVVTAELSKSAVASSGPKKTDENPTALFLLSGWQNGLTAGLSAVNSALFLVLGLIFVDAAQAEDLAIRADKTAPGKQQATILQTANGLPQVNIQTPSAGGVSRNVYAQFDVAEKGAIFNNARKATPTQLAGWVQGNPNLAAGEAKVILNEVNANNPSRLNGYMEVAGRKADVVIANPSGIHCDGCGVINAGRTGFTTGKAELENGKLKGFQVRTGKVTVAGKGMDTSRADYTDIIAKEVEIKGGIWAQELGITTGQNRVNRSNDDVVYVGDKQAAKNDEKTDRTSAARYAVDVSELGGMYAGKIRLVDNDNGLGVRNAGHIGATAGDVTIDSRGQIVNGGTVNSPHHVTLSAQKNMHNQGNIESQQGDIRLDGGKDIFQAGSVIARQGNVDIHAAGNINQSGETLSGNKIRVKAQSVQVGQSALLAVGIEVKESAQSVTRTLSAQGNNGKDLTVNAKRQVVLNGNNIAAGNMSVTGAQIDLNHSRTAANNIALSALQGDIQANRANLTARENLTLTTPKTLSSQYSQVTAKQFSAEQQIFDSGYGVWAQTGDGDFNLRAQQIKNNQGAVVTPGSLLTEADRIENRRGMIYSRQFSANARKLDNRDGEIYADNIALNSKNLDNRKGRIYAQTLAAVSRTVDNRGGIMAASTLNLTASTLHNQASGKTGSLINALNLTIHADTLNNQNTKAAQSVPTQGVVAGNLTIRANQLNNQQGGLYAENSLQTTVEDDLRNERGEMLSADTVEIAGRQGRLTVDNSEGLIEAANRIDIVAESIPNGGKIKTFGDLSVSMKNNFVLNHAFEVGNNLDFKTEGDFENHARLVVGNNTRINANYINNHAEAEISSNQTILKSLYLTNKGLIDGHHTRLESDEITNIGTGRIYGDHISLQGQILNNIEVNNASATIAARERLDIGIQRVLNRNDSLIMSLGDISFGGILNSSGYAQQRAEYVHNENAVIEALGSISFNTKNVENLHRFLKIEMRETSKTHKYEYTFDNETIRYDKGTAGLTIIKRDDRGSFNKKIENLYALRLPDGRESEHWQEYDYIRIVNESMQVPSKYNEAKILSGRNINFTDANIKNYDSKIIAGGNIQVKGEYLDNHETIGEIITTDDGEMTNFYRGRACAKKVLGSCVDHYDTTKSDTFKYNPVKIEPKHFGLWDYVSNQRPQFIGDSSLNPQSLPNTISLNSVSVPYKFSQQPDLSKVKSYLDIRLPQASLYKINPSAGQYLIETDPRFTERRQWLSSDYMLNALPSQNLLKRLGDGYYEQRLVNEQINQLTGRRFLEGYASDYEQYKALMDSGIQYARQFNLIPGVGLTAEQMQNLTSDMVWLVKKTVTLADGTQTEVLAPQVYIVARNADVDSRGAVISANDIIINTKGNVENNGVIAGRNLTGLAANNIENIGGRLQGRELYLFAKNNLVDLGGTLSAENQLVAQANNIHIETTTAESPDTDNFYHKGIGQTATILVGENNQGKATLFANENITVRGAEINIDGNANLTALNKLNMGIVETRNKEYYVKDADNYYKLDQKQAVGNRINVTGDTELTGKSAVDLTGVSSHHDGSLRIISEGDISIKEARKHEKLSTGWKDSIGGLLIRQTDLKRHEHDYDLAQGSQLDADRIQIYSAQGNILVAGSDVVAENGLTMSGKNILIREAENAVYEENVEQTKKSGLLGSGGIGFTIGQRKTTLETDQTKYYASGSQVGSLNGDVSLTAENQYRQQASQVTAVDGDVNIAGKQVDIIAADDRYETNYRQTYEQKGLTIAVTAPVISAIQATDSALKSMSKIGKSENRRINLMAGANTAWDAARAAESIGSAIAPTQALLDGDMKNSSVGISLTYGQQKNVDSTHTEGSTATVSKINAGKRVNIVAKGDENGSDIHITGADISGKQGTYLSADKDLIIQAAKQTHQERSKNKSSGFNAGVSITYGQNGFAMGVTAGGNYGKGYGNGDEVTYAYSHVGDSYSQTLLRSGKDTHIRGTQIQGKGIKVKAENLWIESLQETMTYEGKQMNMSGQVTVGYGFSASGSYSRSKTNASYASVVEQSGIYTGDEGYQIDVVHNTDLKGAVITSTDKAETAGKNILSTGTLSYADIQNYSNYDAEGFGLSGGFTVSGGEAPKDIGGVKLQSIGTNSADGGSKIEYQGVTGIFSQGNWGVAKTLSSAALGQVSDTGRDSGITTSAVNTKNILIRDDENQQQLFGENTEATIHKLNRKNLHQTINKTDVEKVKSDLERDLEITTTLVKNISDSGDELYYNAEKNEDSSFTVSKKTSDCEHISCLDIENDNSQQLKALIYSDDILTEEQAKQLSKISIAGMLNFTREEKAASAILYGDDLASLDDLGVILNRGNAGYWNEFLYAGFERFRAWANVPVVFGASNATKDHAQIAKKLDEYNVYAAVNSKPQYKLQDTAHSLGVSEHKNMLNWSKYLNQDYKNTEVDYLHAAGSYPSEEIDRQAKGIFKEANTRYIGVDGDRVYSGILGGHFIGNNRNATQVKGLSFSKAHSEANQNINNLKYIYRINNKAEKEKWEGTKDALNRVYPNSSVREFNKVNEVGK